jgi:hypothetical protein
MNRPAANWRFTRRDVLKRGLAGAAGFALLRQGALRAFAGPPTPRARAVIQIWMWGGPAHLDTFDPKPGAGRDYCGPLDQADRHERHRRHDRPAPAAARAAGRQYSPSSAA